MCPFPPRSFSYPRSTPPTLSNSNKSRKKWTNDIDSRRCSGIDTALALTLQMQMASVASVTRREACSLTNTNCQRTHCDTQDREHDTAQPAQLHSAQLCAELGDGRGPRSGVLKGPGSSTRLPANFKLGVQVVLGRRNRRTGAQLPINRITAHLI